MYYVYYNILGLMNNILNIDTWYIYVLNIFTNGIYYMTKQFTHEDFDFYFLLLESNIKRIIFDDIYYGLFIQGLFTYLLYRCTHSFVRKYRFVIRIQNKLILKLVLHH